MPTLEVFFQAERIGRRVAARRKGVMIAVFRDSEKIKRNFDGYLASLNDQ